MISTNYVRIFADKIKAMNASKANTLTLTSAEARNLQHEITMLLSLIAEKQESGPIEIVVNGGTFK